MNLQEWSKPVGADEFALRPKNKKKRKRRENNKPAEQAGIIIDLDDTEPTTSQVNNFNISEAFEEIPLDNSINTTTSVDISVTSAVPPPELSIDNTTSFTSVASASFYPIEGNHNFDTFIESLNLPDDSLPALPPTEQMQE
jgi:hypothetical protein